jgi:hypothetical protein
VIAVKPPILGTSPHASQRRLWQIVNCRVEAKTAAEAIQKLFNGENEPVDDSPKYVEVAEDIGLSVDEYRKLADELRALGVSVGHDVIPSIRSIEEID